jgi:hypothetical protein
VRGESAVAAAGADDEGRAGGLLRCREKGGEGGFVFVRVAECAGRAIRPERNGSERRGVERGGEKDGGQGRKEAHGNGVKGLLKNVAESSLLFLFRLIFQRAIEED